MHVRSQMKPLGNVWTVQLTQAAATAKQATGEAGTAASVPATAFDVGSLGSVLTAELFACCALADGGQVSRGVCCAVDPDW